MSAPRAVRRRVLALVIVAAASACGTETGGGEPSAGDGAQPSVEADDPFAAARALLAAGYDDEAREEARSSAVANPGSAIPGEFAAPDDADSLGDRAERWAADLGRILAAVALGLGLLSILTAAWWKFWTWARRRPGVGLGDVAYVGGDEGDVDLLRATLVAELDGARSSAKGVRSVSGIGADVPDLVSLPGQLQVAEKILQRLLRPAVLVIDVTVFKPKTRPEMVQVRIRKHGRLLVEDSFPVPPSTSGLPSLVGAWAAAFVVLQLRDLVGRRRQRVYPGGTDDWRSYGLYRWANLDAANRAQLLHRSLADDHRNSYALSELGARQAIRGGDEEQEEGLEHLEFARELLERRPTRSTGPLLGFIRKGAEVEPLWFQATYRLAVAHLHRLHSREDEDPNIRPDDTDLLGGLAAAEELVDATAATLHLIESWRRWFMPKDLRRELKDVLDADAMYSLGVLGGGRVAEARANGSRGRIDPDPGTALSEDVWGEIRRQGAASLTAGWILATVTSDLDHAARSTLYNVACLYARAHHFDLALQHLEKAASHQRRPGSSREFASQICADPTLAPLRGALADDFKGLVQRIKARDKPVAAPPVASSADQWTVTRPALSE